MRINFAMYVLLTDNTIGFSQSAYVVSESNGSVQPVLILSYPYSTSFTVQVYESSTSAYRSSELHCTHVQ